MSIVRAIPFALRRFRHQPAVLVDHVRSLLGRGGSRRAIAKLSRAAQAGSTAACAELGRAYLFGQGLPCCPGVAMQWLTKAARQDDIEAQFMVASLALQGVSASNSRTLFETASSVTPDYLTALHWTERAAAAGHAPSQALLGFILTSGPAGLRNVTRGDACYRISAEAGCAHGQLGWSLVLLRSDPAANVIEARRHLANAAHANMPMAHYMLGVLAERDPADDCPAAEHYRAGAQLGHGPSQLAFGLALLHGHGLQPDSFVGETWIRRAALAGEVEAEAALGELYARGGALPPNYAEAMLWFGRAAASGHTGATRGLARLHRRGEGVPADPREALRLLRMAAGTGDASSCADLAALVLAHQGTGAGVTVTAEDWRLILASLQEMAERGDLAAAYNVGLCCAAGLGRPADDAEALAWFRVAADRLAVAQYSCGRMLAEGRGISQDLAGARRYLLQASEQGLPEAEALAGEMFLNGRGGPADLATAKKLLRGAADAGHPGSLYALGVMALGFYEQPEDLVSAEAFLRKAAERGHPGALATLSRHLHHAPVDPQAKQKAVPDPNRDPADTGASASTHARHKVLEPV